MVQRYEDNFSAEEKAWQEYRPSPMERCHYCGIFPGTLNERTGAFEFAEEEIMARIIPLEADRVKIAGIGGCFDILPFSQAFAVLDNGMYAKKEKRKALIRMADIRRCSLKTKEGTGHGKE